jgi:hypothetical protein
VASFGRPERGPATNTTIFHTIFSATKALTVVAQFWEAGLPFLHTLYFIENSTRSMASCTRPPTALT